MAESTEETELNLKPICYDGTSFQDHPVKKEGKKPEIDSFQDPKPIQRWKPCASKWTPVTWMPDPWLFDETSTHHTPTFITITITSAAILTQITFTFTSCTHLPPRESSVGAPLRGLYTYRQEETSVWTSPHQTSQHWQRTHTQTLSTIAGNITPSTLQVGEISQSKSQTGFQHYGLNSFWNPLEEKCKIGANWLVSRPLYIHIWDTTLWIDFFQDPVIYHHNWLISKPLVHIQH